MTVSVLLAVDDRPDNLFVLEQVVGAYLPEIKMITAESAEAGLALAATEAIDGALIDVQMPGLNGIEMCRRLKADPRTAPIHVILVTAHGATSELKAQGLEAGADDFIAKPIDNVELAAKLRVMLRLRAAENALRRERDHLEEAVRKRTQALRDAENRYRTLFQAAADPIFISTLEGRLLEVNEEACRLLGYTRDELLHLTVYDLVTPEYAARRPEILKRLQVIDHLLFETELVPRDGRIIPAETSSRMMDFQGRPAVLSITRNITERKAAAAALRQSEARFRAIFDQAGVGVAQINTTTGGFIAINQRYCDMVGYDRDDLLSINVMDITHPDDLQADLDNMHLLKTGKLRSFSMDKRYVHKDGDIIWVRLTVSPMWDIGAPPDFHIAVVEDITERRQAEEALRESEERFKTMFSEAPLGIALIDSLTGHIYEVNPMFARIAGRTVEQMANIDWMTITHPDDVQEDLDNMALLNAGKIPGFQMEKRYLHLDGAAVWINMTIAPLKVKDKARPRHLCMIEDITERRRAEARLRESEELYRSLFENMLNGFAYSKMLFDQGQPQDFIYLSVNHSFEALTGLKNVVGKKVSEVIPGIGESDPELLKIYGRVALTGKPERFETFVEALQMWFSLSVYSPEKEYFVAVFDVITERKQAEEALKESLARTTEVQNGTIEALATVSEVRDPYTAGHQRRVTKLACAVARELGLPSDQVAGLRVIGLLHDMGKISIPAEILSKPGKLSDTEFAIIKSHAQAGYEIVKEIRFPWPVAEVILQHHERLDGSGYPQGLQGDEIVRDAKILAVADVVEAMVSHRPYRPALGIELALEEIAQKKGVLYDPEVVDACLKLFAEKRFQFDEKL